MLLQTLLLLFVKLISDYAFQIDLFLDIFRAGLENQIVARACKPVDFKLCVAQGFEP